MIVMLGASVSILRVFAMQAAARREPRMQMGHLLIWIVGCAVGFAAYRSITPPRIRTPRDLAIVTGYNLAMGTAFGTILTGCGLLAYRRWKGDLSYPSRAGHRLLLFGLAAAAAYVAAVEAYQYRAMQAPALPVGPYLAQFITGPPGFAPVMYHHAVGWGVGALAALGFLRALRDRLERHWLAVFHVFSLAGATLAIAHITSLVLGHYPVDTSGLNRLLVHVYAGSILVGALAILWAIVRDRRSGVPTDSLHRLGIGAWLAIAAIQMVMYLLYLV
jgi:hypothetical protein